MGKAFSVQSDTEAGRLLLTLCLLPCVLQGLWAQSTRDPTAVSSVPWVGNEVGIGAGEGGHGVRGSSRNSIGCVPRHGVQEARGTTELQSNEGGGVRASGMEINPDGIRAGGRRNLKHEHHIAGKGPWMPTSRRDTPRMKPPVSSLQRRGLWGLVPDGGRRRWTQTSQRWQ